MTSLLCYKYYNKKVKYYVFTLSISRNKVSQVKERSTNKYNTKYENQEMKNKNKCKNKLSKIDSN
jgi:hypothetical protein